MVQQAFLTPVYLLMAFLATGSWALYIGLVLASATQRINREFIVLRIAITTFGVVSYAVFTFASFNIGVPDGNGGIIIESYSSMAAIGVMGALGMGLFLIDSVMKAMSDEMPSASEELEAEF